MLLETQMGHRSPGEGTVSKTGESLSCQHVKEVDGRGEGRREVWSQLSQRRHV